jgi:hypothetical protein
MLALPAAAAAKVREYDPEHDHAPRDELLETFRRHRTGAGWTAATARSSPLTTEPPHRWRLVYEDVGRLFGYVATNVFGEDVSTFEASVNLQEVAFDLDHPEAVVTLIKHVLWAARTRGARRVTARLPWDARLFAVLRDAGLVFQRVELFNTVTGNMLRIVSFAGLIERICPELQQRWQAAGPEEQTNTALLVDDWTADLRLPANGEGGAPGKLETTEPSPPTERVAADAAGLELRVRLSQFEFLALLLGLWPIEQTLASPPPDSRVMAVLRKLFPVQPTASGTWC